ncbi:uncharacterized protein LOC110630299 isoform X2 [Manihot esculenta]|uniref:RING-type domain-containing protein n=2 Tax=Manihot esculenta TaxID=3983 RepID=A0A251JXC9_MANES|nr:uncharacterized protein LOC110630299 isoform X2 [Manihot esculenta]OAY32804.1 hypothetical protein MANES_13G047000v8 [Manihot esculenta]OAY32805.1 hypothetical protein MANES_13G047000v8 [Manihot esculenta]
MSAFERRDLAGLTLDAVLNSAYEKQPPVIVSPTPAQVNRSLLDIIRNEERHGSLFGHKDKSWKAFRERLRQKRAGSAWTSSVPIPASDIPIQNNNYNFNNGTNQRSFMCRRNSARFTTVSSPTSGESIQTDDSRQQMSRWGSSRCRSPTPSESTGLDGSSMHALAVGDGLPSRSFMPQMSPHNCPDLLQDSDEEHRGAALASEGMFSAREAVVAQEAAEAAAQAAAAAASEDEEASGPTNEGTAEAEPAKMSLLDLLEETDREMGLVGSSYTVGDKNRECYEEEEGDDDDEADGGIEHTCCVCMVRHKGAAFIPCGHTFCRLCSRELWVQRGNCPLCNGFILEVLDIF